MPDASTAAERLAVIPARGGSRRIPRKNVRLLSGRPLLAWTVDLALASGLFEHVIVSTDDSEVADVARAAGALVPFLRDADLATDTAATVDVIADAVRRMRGRGFDGDIACCLYPAAVLVDADDLRGSLALLDSAGTDYVAAVMRFAHPIQRAMILSADGRLAQVDPVSAMQRTQDLEPRWHDAGQFYWGRVEAWLAATPILSHAAGYELAPTHAVDIDNETDWQLAELLHRARRS